MTAPTFKKPTDTATDPTNAKYGVPDIKYAFDVLDGSHATDKIQANVIENNIKEADFVVRINGSTYEAINVNTGGSLVAGSQSTTDAAVAINAAINALPTAGGKVFLKAGTYTINGVLTQKSNMVLEGAGWNQTILSKNFNGDFWVWSGQSNMILRDIKLLGNRASFTGRGIILLNTAGGNNNLIENVFFADIESTCIDLRQDKNYIRNCRIENCAQNAIWLVGSSTTQVKDCVIQNVDILNYGQVTAVNAETAGIRLSYTIGCIISGGSIKTNITGGKHAIWITGTGGKQNTIRGVYCDGTHHPSAPRNADVIRIENEGNLIADCMILNGEGDGIGCSAASNNTIVVGNYCVDNDNPGIEFNGCNDCLALGNVVKGALAQKGLFCSGDRNNLIGNIVNGNDQEGISLNDIGGGTIANDCIVMGNQVWNNDRAQTGFAGIRTVNANDCLILGNRCGDNQGTKTQDAGINITATTTTDRNLIAWNNLRDNATTALTSVGTTHRIQDNEGYNPKVFAQATYVVSREDSTYYAINGQTGAVLSSSTTTPETVIQAAIDAVGATSIGTTGGGTVYIKDGTYEFSAGFTGLTISKSFVRIIMGAGVLLHVPNGYTGVCFLFNPITTHGAGDPIVAECLLQGGHIQEGGTWTQTRSWTAIRVECSRNGTFQNMFRDLSIEHCNKGIELLYDDETSWATVNFFDNIWIADPVIGIDFVNSVAGGGDGGFARNVFSKISIQSGSGVSPQTTPTHGIKGICGTANAFYSCISYDFIGGSITSSLTSIASKTLIIGGALTQLNWDDKGVNTYVWDEWKSGITKTYTAERYGSGSPSFIGIRGDGTKGSPTATGSNTILAELVGRGYDGSAVTGDRAAIQLRTDSAWTGTNNITYIDFLTTANNTTSMASVFRIHHSGNIGMIAGKKLALDGLTATGDTYLIELTANKLQAVAGGTVGFEARATHALTKGFSGTADPTTTDIPAGYFTVAKNTTSGDVKMFYNDGGTLKSLTLA